MGEEGVGPLRPAVNPKSDVHRLVLTSVVEQSITKSSTNETFLFQYCNEITVAKLVLTLQLPKQIFHECFIHKKCLNLRREIDD